MSGTPRRSDRLVAVVVPLSNRPHLTADEQISMNHVQRFLGGYDRYLAAPRGLAVDRPGFRVKRFDDKFFGSALGHTKLQLAPAFYESFREYKYILMYHLDALVFSDQLRDWCEEDWDFIGAPWLPSEDSPWVKTPRVGNSGFCLMKVESFLKVLYSRNLAVDPDEYWAKLIAGKPTYARLLNLPRKYLKRLRVFNGVKREAARWPYVRNSDRFWSDRATTYYPGFKIAPVEVGLRFAFEVAPRRCFQLNGRQLPFGCHAWARYDRDFWQPYLLKEEG